MRRALYILVAIFFLALFLRALYLPQLALTFGYDQARDAYIAQEIASGDIKLLGPPASTPGLFHGVFYYYFLAPAYFIGGGSPVFTAYYLAFWSSATVFILFAMGYLMTKKIQVGLLAAFLFSISFEASQYGIWLSNPTLGVFTVPTVYLGLWLWLGEDDKDIRRRFSKWGPVLTGVGLGLSAQAEIFLMYHAVPVVLWLWLGKRNVGLKGIVSFGVSFLLSVLTMILVEIKFGFQGLGGIANLASSGDAIVRGKGLGDFFVLFLNQIGKTFSNSLLPLNAGYGGILGVSFIVYALYLWGKEKKKKEVSWQLMLCTYVLAHLTVVSVGGISTPFLLVGIGSGLAVLAACVLVDIWRRQKNLALLIISVITVSNVVAIVSENKEGQTIFSIQKDMVLAKQLAAIDYTYESSGGEDFSINTLTSPLWINNVWSYLYQWYGKKEYGYLPEWHGRDQVGQLSDNLLHAREATVQRYLINEPMQGIPSLYLELTVGEEDANGSLVEERHFGEITVQKRLRGQQNDG